jgi:hypothetical protein
MTRTLIALARSELHHTIAPYLATLMVCVTFAAWPTYHPSRLPALGSLAQTVVGAAPEYSVSPVDLGNLQSRWEVFQTQTLPVEAVSQDTESGAPDLMSSPAANTASLAPSGAAASLGPLSDNPSAGSGALLKLRRSAHPSAFFSFAIRQPVRTLRPSTARSAPLKTKTTSNAQHTRPIRTLADAGLVLRGAIGGEISGATIGRRVPALGILGGGTPGAAKVAATINGATFRPKL